MRKLRFLLLLALMLAVGPLFAAPKAPANPGTNSVASANHHRRHHHRRHHHHRHWRRHHHRRHHHHHRRNKR